MHHADPVRRDAVPAWLLPFVRAVLWLALFDMLVALASGSGSVDRALGRVVGWVVVALTPALLATTALVHLTRWGWSRVSISSWNGDAWTLTLLALLIPIARWPACAERLGVVSLPADAAMQRFVLAASVGTSAVAVGRLLLARLRPAALPTVAAGALRDTHPPPPSPRRGG